MFFLREQLFILFNSSQLSKDIIITDVLFIYVVLYLYNTNAIYKQLVSITSQINSTCWQWHEIN